MWGKSRQRRRTHKKAPDTGGTDIRGIVSAYDSFITRAYCLLRFRIIRGRFLEEIAQFLPTQGSAMEIGCGFGLFGLYFARKYPGLHIRGVDLDTGRIEAAERARLRLSTDNISFEVGDARTVSIPEGLDAIYMLDIVHHIPPESAVELLRACRAALAPGAVLVIKDVDTRPRYKMAFTWLLDLLMTGGERPDYWCRQDLLDQLRSFGFDVFSYAMLDALPYPHQLYVCRVPSPATATCPEGNQRYG